MTFRWPALLVLEVAVPLAAAAYVAGQRRRARRMADLAERGLVLAPGAGAGAVGQLRRHVPVVCTLVALAVVLLAVARPTTGAVDRHPSGTVVLAFDVSNSMLATDVAPTRLDAAKGAARRFVQEQPATVALGVVAFGSGSVVVQQATTARADVLAAIDRLNPGGGTSTGQGLFASLGVIVGHPLAVDPTAVSADTALDLGYHRDATIVLLSDGEDTGGPDPLVVAGLASGAGIRISAIGVGTPAGAVLAVDGYQISTALQEEQLQALAQATGGTYQRAQDDAGLDDAYDAVDLPVTAEGAGHELTGAVATAGAVLLVLGAALSSLWLGRVA